MNDKLTAFLRTKPPTFAGSCNPLDADDWLRVIQRKLEPFECQDRDKVLLAAHQPERHYPGGKTIVPQPKMPPPLPGENL
jgi:hypothetical protein